MLEVLQDPDHAALVGWIAMAALTIMGSLGWIEIRNERAHRGLERRIDNIADRVDSLVGRTDSLYQVLLERLPPKP